MLDLNNSSVWLEIKKHLESSLENAVSGLQNQLNDREKDIAYKARIAVIKELLDLPRTIRYAAK